MRSWYDGLGSGRGRLLGPPELGPIGPDASQDHGDLAGYGDTRLLRSDAPRQPRSPCLEGRPALHFREKDAGSLIKTGAGKSVPAFRYPALPIRFSGLIPSRRQSEIGADIPSPLEPVRLIDRGAECKGCYRPDASHRHDPSQWQVVADKTTDLLVQSRHLSNGNLPHFDQFVDERRQDRMVLGEHPRALGESTFVAAGCDTRATLERAAITPAAFPILHVRTPPRAQSALGQMSQVFWYGSWACENV